jgi:transcriptional regulator with XRE-family HTH domain
MLAGLSVEYYSRLERGNLRGVSEAVLEALARALRLSEAERAHLYNLVRAANSSRRELGSPRLGRGATGRRPLRLICAASSSTSPALHRDAYRRGLLDDCRRRT